MLTMLGIKWRCWRSSSSWGIKWQNTYLTHTGKGGEGQRLSDRWFGRKCRVSKQCHYSKKHPLATDVNKYVFVNFEFHHPEDEGASMKPKESTTRNIVVLVLYLVSTKEVCEVYMRSWKHISCSVSTVVHQSDLWHTLIKDSDFLHDVTDVNAVLHLRWRFPAQIRFGFLSWFLRL